MVTGGEIGPPLRPRGLGGSFAAAETQAIAPARAGALRYLAELGLRAAKEGTTLKRSAPKR
jgi:hypothetical protein